MSSAFRAERGAEPLAPACPYFGALIDLERDQSGDLPGALRTGADATLSIDGLIADMRAAVEPASLADISIEGRPSSSAILERLRRWGVALMPGLLPADLVRALDTELAGMLRDRAALSKSCRVDEEPGSICIRMETDRLDAGIYPATSGVFASPLLRSISDAYYGDAEYSFNHVVFAHQTNEHMAPPSGEVHFDVTRMLKFWIYLSDATIANGAMRIAPGSNLWLRMARRDYSDRLTPKAKIPNNVHGLDEAMLHLVGPPGTMFIFDTDAAHAASPVAAGAERRIMRAHCTETELIARAKARG